MFTKEDYIRFALAYKQRAYEYWYTGKPQYAFANKKMEVISLLKAEILSANEEMKDKIAFDLEDPTELVKMFKSYCPEAYNKVHKKLLKRFSRLEYSWVFVPEQ